MYHAFGGAAGVRNLTDRFYDLMELEPQYHALRQMHGEDMTLIREKLYEFFSGWLGGPPLFEQKYGHPMLRARHMPFAVNITTWIMCRSRWLKILVSAPARDTMTGWVQPAT